MLEIPFALSEPGGSGPASARALRRRRGLSSAGIVALGILFAAFAGTAIGAAKDTAPPSVAIASPASGVTVQGTITLAASASDNVGVVGVQFRIDGANLGAEVRTQPFALNWNTALYPNGPHAITAVARDAAGNRRTSLAMTYTVANTPATIACVQTGVVDCRVLGLDVTPAQDGNYDAAFALARGVGVDAASLTIDWNTIERAPGVFDGSNFDIADVYYPAYRTALALALNPLSTNYLALPSDLAGKALDDPQVIARFIAFARFALGRMQHVALAYITIGMEADVYLGTDPATWAAYTRFYEAVAPAIRAMRPGVPVGSELTYNGLTGPQASLASALNRTSDGIWVSYLPLDADFQVLPPTSVRNAFDALNQRYPGRRIYYTQIGYPSSPGNGSSEELQRQFVAETFAAWDASASQTRMVRFIWQTDIPSDALAQYQALYGFGTLPFLSFLGSLGLRHDAGGGVDKPAWQELSRQTRARGW